MDKEMTFGKFIQTRRKGSSKGYTLKDMSEALGISLTMLCDIENGRRKPSRDMDYEVLAQMLDLNEEEKITMYDLAAENRHEVPCDVEKVILNTESGNLARMALRMTGDDDVEDWKKFIWALEKKRAAEKGVSS